MLNFGGILELIVSGPTDRELKSRREERNEDSDSKMWFGIEQN